MAKKYEIQIKITNGKVINLCLDSFYAPKTVENFVKLIHQNYFDGVIFHRVINNFMIQTGGYKLDGFNIIEAGDAECIEGEFAQNGFQNDLKHTLGVISMARTNDPNSANSQFFICSADANWLDGAYAAFGYCTDEESKEVVKEIAAMETTTVAGYFQDFPVDIIGIETIIITKEE